ncbi:MAG: hypothetical protein ACI8ZM_000307 [Crocinitomix sp.]|jgi:hypothetical protein
MFGANRCTKLHFFLSSQLLMSDKLLLTLQSNQLCVHDKSIHSRK